MEEIKRKDKEVFISTYFIKESQNLNRMEHLTIHRVSIAHHNTDKRGGWYRQVTAMEGFLGRLSKRFSKHWYNKKRYHLNPIPKYCKADSYDISSLMHFCKAVNTHGTKRDREYYPTITWVCWASIWDFFNYIGYDYKNKSIKELDRFIALNAY